jgi:hypothetical protein
VVESRQGPEAETTEEDRDADIDIDTDTDRGWAWGSNWRKASNPRQK